MVVDRALLEQVKQAEREYEDEIIGESTLVELFDENTRRFADVDAQLYKGGVYDRSLTPSVVPTAPDGEYASITYERMGEIVRRLATGFRELGVADGDRVSIFADTRLEWGQSDYALLSAGAIPTTVYTESGPRQINYLVNHPGAVGIVCENEALLDDVVKINSHLDLEFVVVFDELDKYADVDGIYTLREVYELGAEQFDRDAFDSWLEARSLDDLASIIYTSGTTGIPKGAKLTHRNFRANVNQIWKRSGPRPDKDDDVPQLGTHTRTISFLPLAHVFERTIGHFLMFSCGATVGYAESPDTVADDITKIQPTAGASVPRVYERIFDKMRDEASSNGVKERIFQWAVEVARTEATADDHGLGHRLRYGIADALVYSDVREQMGGNVEYMVSGGGTLNKRLSELFLGMGIPIYEGYGLTEAAPVVTSALPEAPQPGTLGMANPGVDVRLKPIDEDTVDAEVDGEVGELEFMGDNVFEGYWKMPERTASSFTEDGYFRTGDIVERREDDHFIYHDRQKNLLVLTTGKNVSPEPIESAFATSQRIEQIMVIGDDRKFIGALVVPNFEAVRNWAADSGIDVPEDDVDLCNDERVREWINEEIRLVNREFGDEEQIKQFELVPTEWTADNDLLTPSLKKKRRNILDEFEHKVQAIYAQGETRVTDQQAPAAADD
jgi:long-chain acyl-CoA synthetase